MKIRYNFLRLLLLFFILKVNFTIFSLKCYSCANDFVVWHWRHFFLRRNYALGSSDNECMDKFYTPESLTVCSTSCFIFILNGTDKNSGNTITLGVGRGCSSQFLSEEQYMSRGLGIYSGKSNVGKHLTQNFDKYALTEHWCFCDTDKCNYDHCFTDFRKHHIAAKQQFSQASLWNPTNVDNIPFPSYETDSFLGRRRSPTSQQLSFYKNGEFDLWSYSTTGVSSNVKINYLTLTNTFLFLFFIFFYYQN
ncbi:Hypothetical protein SRAE_1000240100 [Strongyloides ratti]|uniref:Caenorhabditis elegans ly-6-related family-containing protein n=1 Tax=Strongyloides ratti TaxID=34506 RepID=A0A090L2W4_STRRB|nr:Hypothetical protein SRAE_1000240100 [Strongyloides ratti]CEF64146.1 Hypothetical protein SRAE_1000240100 [Strongyloides ratti]